jgi:hypothetical protein
MEGEGPPSRLQIYPLLLAARRFTPGLHGSVGRKEESYDNVQSSASAHDSNLIAANDKYFAVPWQGGGGPFFINQLDKPGKIDATPSLFQGHSGAIQDLDFSPFEQEVLSFIHGLWLYGTFSLINGYNVSCCP